VLLLLLLLLLLLFELLHSKSCLADTARAGLVKKTVLFSKTGICSTHWVQTSGLQAPVKPGNINLFSPGATAYSTRA
jgi:hypothetical protein